MTHWNRACEELTGIKADKILRTKKHNAVFYPDKADTMADLILRGACREEMKQKYGETFRHSGLLKESFEAQGYFPDMGTDGKWLFITAGPLRDIRGRLCGAIETLQDITEEKRKESTLKTTLKTLEILVEKVWKFNS